MDVEEMRKKAKLAITPAMLKKSKGVSSIIKLTPWYTRRHMANEDKCSCHVVSYTNPRLHPLKKAIIGIKFKVHRKYSRGKRLGRVAELSNALIDVIKKQAEDMRVKTNFNINMLVQINKK